MKYIDKIKDYFKSDMDEVERNCPLNPFLRDYYDELEPEYYDEAIKNTRSMIRDNRDYINYLKVKLRENKTCRDFYNMTQYDNLVKNEILEKEYMINTAQYIVFYLKHKKKKYLESQKKNKEGATNGKQM